MQLLTGNPNLKTIATNRPGEGSEGKKGKERGKKGKELRQGLLQGPQELRVMVMGTSNRQQA